MGLIQSMVSPLAASLGFEPRRDVNDARWWGENAIQTLSGQAVTADSVMGLDVVQSIQERLGGSVSTLPLMIYRRTGPDSREVARDHPLFQVLHRRPNRRMTAQLFRDEQQRHLSTWRNCYARIIPGQTPVDELDPIHPRRVTRIEKGSDGWVYYTVRRVGPGATGFDTYREDEIFHIKKAPLTEDGLRGKAIWETSRETFGRAQAVEQFGALYFANGGSGGGVLEHPGNFKDKEARDAFMEAWRMGGAGLNRHKDRLLLFGLKYSPFTVKNDEAQFLETLKEATVKICRLWNMPPHMVGMLDKATFSNIEQQSIEYVVHTLAPWIVAWEQACGHDLLIGSDQEEYFVEFNVAGLLRGDLKARYSAYFQGRQGGWLSVNDIRRAENMEPIGPAGDDYLQPLNMTPAGKAAPDDGKDPEDAAS